MVLPGQKTIGEFKNKDTPPAPFWVWPTIFFLIFVGLAGITFTLVRRRRNKKRAAKERADAKFAADNKERLALEKAEASKEQALRDQESALELKKRGMVYPKTWSASCMNACTALSGGLFFDCGVPDTLGSAITAFLNIPSFGVCDREIERHNPDGTPIYKDGLVEVSQDSPEYWVRTPRSTTDTLGVSSSNATRGAF
jgi:hypothetical protein